MLSWIFTSLVISQYLHWKFNKNLTTETTYNDARQVMLFHRFKLAFITRYYSIRKSFRSSHVIIQLVGNQWVQFNVDCRDYINKPGSKNAILSFSLYGL